MGLREIPEWMKKGGNDDDPLQTEVRKHLDRISSRVEDTCNKKFTVTKEDGRLLVSMQREDSAEALFTVSEVEDGEYLLMDADATPRDLPIFVGPRDEMLERMKNELLHTYLESWELKEAPDADDLGLTQEDLDAIERLINPDPDKPKPPEMN